MDRMVRESSIRSRIAKRRRSQQLFRSRMPLFAALGALIVVGVAIILMQNGMAAQHEEIVLDCHYIGEVAHTHDKSCYNADGDLVCPLRERELHTHTDDCYERQLICGQEESDEHTHTDACYKNVLICGKEELTDEHIHGDGCFRTIIVPGPAEDDATGTSAASPDAASDNAAANTPDGVAKSAPSDDVPAMPAQTFTEALKDADGKTVLTIDVQAPAGALPEGSTMTASLVNTRKLDKKQLRDTIATEIDGKIVDLQAAKVTFKNAKGTAITPDKGLTVTLTSTLLGEGKDAAKLVRLTPAADSDSTPKAELVDLFGETSLKARDLTVNPDQVAFESSRFSTFVLATVTGDLTLRATPDGARVRVDAPAAAGIPAGSTLQATEITPDDDAYDDYRSEALETAGATDASVARFFDITILDPSGAEIQPAEPVRVRIKLDDAPAPDATPEIVHFADGASSAERVTDVEVNKAIAGFEAESFSVYGVIYTVDFAYDVDGETYETSVKGGEVINLKKLLLTLHVADRTDLNDFVDAIAKVEFSNPDLIRVIKVDHDTTAGEIKSANDIQPTYSADLTEADIARLDARKLTAPNYALASLKSFDTSETLTITMANGDVFTIAVADAVTNPGSSQQPTGNTDPNRLNVQLEWRTVDDWSQYPEVRFTLYQGQIVGNTVQNGQPYENGRYSDIPLNTDNGYTWICPEELPAGYGYYVVQEFSTESGAGINQVDVYQNSEVDVQGNITTPGARIDTNGQLHAEDQRVFIYDYYNTANGNHAKRQDQNAIVPTDGAMTSNVGTITIVDRHGKYKQMDVSKKWLLYADNGELKTLTSEVRGDTVMKVVFMRRMVRLDAPATYGADDHDDPSDYVDDGWVDYGVPFYVGYQNGEVMHVNPNNFILKDYSDWLWEIEDQNPPQGLPCYGYHEKADGTLERVRYRYIIHELGIYKNANEDPIDVINYSSGQFDPREWEVISDLLPHSWDAVGSQVPTFPKIVAQDQDRLVNKQSSDLYLEKQWDSVPSGVSKVYVKVFRRAKNGGEVEDVTNKIGVATTMMSDWGYVDDPSMVGFSGDVWNTDLSPNPGSDTKIGGYIILDATGDKSHITIHGMELANTGSGANMNTNPYEYWIQEIGYMDSNGQSSWVVNHLNPRYDHWEPSGSSGQWTTDAYTDATDNKITIGKIGDNKLRVTNTPTSELKVNKEWWSAEGYNSVFPFTRDPAIDKVLYRIRRVGTDGSDVYIKFREKDATSGSYVDIGTDLPLMNKTTGYIPVGNGEYLTVQARQDGADTYDIVTRKDSMMSWISYGGQEVGVPPWESHVYGLQLTSEAGGNHVSYTYSVEEVGYLDVNGDLHPASDFDWSHEVIDDGHNHFTIKNSESNIVLRKQWLDGSGSPTNPNRPWDSSLDEVTVSINQIRSTYEVNYAKYGDYDNHLVPSTSDNPNPAVVPLQGLQDLKIKQDNKVLYVKPTVPESDTYTITSNGYLTPVGTESDRMGADDWALMIYGLEKYAAATTPEEDVHIQTQYSYEIVETPIDNCKTTYDAANDAGDAGVVEVGGSVTIKNQRDSVKITVGKTFVGLDDVLDGLTTDDIRDDYDSLSADVKKLLEGITLKLYNADSPLPSELNGNGTVFEMTLKQLTQLGILEYDPATFTFSGTVDRDTAVAGVSTAPLLPGSKFELAETGQDAAATIPTGMHYVSNQLAANPSNKIPTTDEGELSLVYTNTYEPLIDIELLKVDIDNRDNANPSATLKGAEFELWKYKDTGDPDTEYMDGLDTSFGTNGKMTIADGTPADGKFALEGLKPGHYELHETKVPDGHIMMDGHPRFEVAYNSTLKKLVVEPGAYAHDASVTTPDPDDVAFVAQHNGTWRIIYGNPPGSELPHSGGPGTVLGTVAGVALMAAGAVHLLRSRRRCRAEAQE